MSAKRKTGHTDRRPYWPAGVAAALALVLWGGAAFAKEVRYPKADPKIVLDVPDDWAIDETKTGLEIRSPEKNSIIVAQVVSRKRGVVEAWTKDAASALKAFGVSFDQKVGTTSTAVAPLPASPPSPAPAAIATTKPADPAVAPGGPGTFTFSGAPSLETPGTVASNRPIDPGQFSVEALTGFDGKIKRAPKLHFKTIEYVGTTMNGKPVDVELAIYTLSDERVFLLMQESEPTDNRSVAIAKSLRGTKDSDR